ncbi:endophilin-B1-like isoform X2 [Liolophura sinensis]|uniref:endophilin-B1-like isoform X2 n=1 Tax=Liolophura sinensis TaxID=3198878 RepID=UPI0031594182
METESFSAKMKKFAAGASTYLNRVVQFTEEKIGSAEKTELDAHFENLIQRAEKTKVWTEKILRQTETVLQPNPNSRMEDLFYEKLDKPKRERVTNFDQLGQFMVDAGNDFGPGTAYGNALVKAGQTQYQLGQAEKDFVGSVANNFLQPLRNFLDGDMKTIQKEKKLLETKRLDLDACKNRLRKAKSQANQQQDTDAVAKAEAELRVAQADFDRQAEITKLLLEGVSSTHAHHLRCLNDFIEAQVTYFAQCQQYMTDLQRQLGSYPAGTGAGGVGGGPGNSSLPNIHPPHLSNSNLNSQNQPSAPPAIQVTEASPTDKKQARVLYDYDAADSSELSLLADEYIIVYTQPGLNPDWMMAERKEQRGKVPVTYLELLD